jgi:hypothetical protein
MRDPGWHTQRDSSRTDVSGDDRAGTHHAAASEPDPREHDGVGAHPDVVLDHHLRELRGLVPHRSVAVGKGVLV